MAGKLVIALTSISRPEIMKSKLFQSYAVTRRLWLSVASVLDSV